MADWEALQRHIIIWGATLKGNRRGTKIEIAQCSQTQVQKKEVMSGKSMNNGENQ